MEIKDIQGNILVDVPVTESAVKTDELMKQHNISLSWSAVTDNELPLGSYIEYEGIRYSLLSPYRPQQKDEAEYEYKPVFEHPVMRWQYIPFFFYTYSEGKVVSKELDWDLTDNPANFMKAVCDAILNETGEDWSYEISADLPASVSLSFSNADIFSALNTIASAFETEWWFDYANKIAYLSKASYGDAVTLEVGQNIGIPSKNQNKDGYYTRFYAFGSTRNIEQNYAGSNVNSIVNKRLTLNPAKYPNGYIDIREGLTESEILVKTLVFDDIYPRSSLAIADVKVRLMWRLDNDNKKVQIGTDSNGNPVYDQYAIWYFKVPGLQFDKDSIVSGKPLSVHFNSGALNGREFELTYHDTEEDVETSDGTSIHVEKGDFEINFIEEGTFIIPAISGLVPNDGDEITLFNIKMPEEYKTSAYNVLEEAVLKEIAKQDVDNNNYTFESNKAAFYDSNPNLTVGRKVLYKNGNSVLETRVIKLETQLDYAFEQKITIGNEQIKGTTQTLKEEVVNANQNIDLISAINESTQQLMQSYQRTQKALLDSMAKWGDMWQLDKQNNAVYTPLNLIVEGTIGMGDLGEGGSGEVVTPNITIKFDGSEIPYTPDANGVITLPAYPEGGGGGTAGLGSVTVRVNRQDYITDASGIVTIPNYPTTLPASDVYAWAKASVKPSYTASEVGALSLSGGTISSASSYAFNVQCSSGDKSVAIGFKRGESDTAYLDYRGNSEWRVSGNTLYHSGNFNPADYLPLSGGTLSNGTFAPLTIKGSSSYAGIGVQKAGESAQSYLVYVGEWDWRITNANWGDSKKILHENNYSSYALPLSGGMIGDGSLSFPLIVKGTAAQAGVILRDSGLTNKAAFSWESGVGTYIFNYASGKYLSVKDDGTPTYSGNTLIHSGNIGSYNAKSADVIGYTYSNQSINFASNESKIRLIKSNSGDASANGFPSQYVGGISVLSDYVGWQMVTYGSIGTPNPYFRSFGDDERRSEWRKLAFLDDNVASAKEVKTSDGKQLVFYNGVNTLYIGGGVYSDAQTDILGKKVVLRYGASATNGLILNENGNVLIGTTTDNGYKLQVNGDISFTKNIVGSYASIVNRATNPYFKLNDANYTGYLQLMGDGGVAVGSTSTRSLIVAQNGNTSIAGNLTATGDITSEGTMAMAKLASSSDRKLKDNIAEVSAEQSMSIIRQLRPASWDWKKDGKKSYGFIAQEVEPIVPEMVVNMEHLHLEYNQLHAFEIGAIKHIDSEVDKLKKDLAIANGRIEVLENELKQYRRSA